MSILDVVTWGLVLFGSALTVIGGVGLIRMPDFYSRCHAAGLTDSGGAAFIVVGLMLQSGWSLITFKLLTVLIFVWLSSPASTHALTRAAHARGVHARSSR